MVALVFIIPAMIMALIGILVYGAFAVIWSAGAAAEASGRVAPNHIGWVLGIGFLALSLSRGLLLPPASGLEGFIYFLVAVCIGSVVMLFTALILRGKTAVADAANHASRDKYVEKQIQDDIANGRLGLRRTAYTDNAHERALAARKRKEAKEMPPPKPPTDYF